MKISYYPGCTLKTNAKNFEDSTLCSLERLGVDVEELTRWNCCGTVFSLATDDLIHHVAPIRNLIRARQAKSDTLMTLCAMCYNTLKRAHERVKKDPEALEKINKFIDAEEISYAADVKVLHLLEILRDEVKFETITKKVSKPLKGLKVASYYGCMLVRPKEIGLDDVENPTILEKLTALSARPPSISRTKPSAAPLTRRWTSPRSWPSGPTRSSAPPKSWAPTSSRSAARSALLTSTTARKKPRSSTPDFKPIPVVYFTQLLAIALGCPEEILCAWTSTTWTPSPCSRKKH